MNQELMEYYKKKINDLLEKGITRKSQFPCSTFYVNKSVEIELGTLRLVINYKPLNQAHRWIIYPIPNKNDLLSLHCTKVFSKFNMKSELWQI